MEMKKKIVTGILIGVAIVTITVVIAVTTQKKSSSSTKPWLNGDYDVSGFAIAHVDDNVQTFRQLKFLDSEADAMKSMSWAEGEDDKTVLITLFNQTVLSTISQDKKTVTFPLQSIPGGLKFTWITPEEAEIINNREKEPIDAPKVPYPLRPGVKGKFAFLTGPPGSGKSTIAAIIAKNEGWVFYEGDGFSFGFNPYIFPNESQVEARTSKANLIGVGMEKRLQAVKERRANLIMRNQNLTKNREPTDIFYKMMAQDILRERNRVGGDWIVAQAIQNREDRKIVREVLGKDLVFVVLDISLELVKKRLAGRGKGEEHLAMVHSTYEPASADEPNTVGYTMLEEKTPNENAKAVLDLINSKSKN